MTSEFDQRKTVLGNSLACKGIVRLRQDQTLLFSFVRGMGIVRIS